MNRISRILLAAVAVLTLGASAAVVAQGGQPMRNTAQQASIEWP
ncbi:hypothetical protein ABT270_20105 [Streptomyces sp900105245]